MNYKAPLAGLIVSLSMLLALGAISQHTKAQAEPGSAAARQQPIEAPIVVELFTSQSCSSCPSADRLLRKLSASNKNILALSCHVTYWDHLSWKDTLSRSDCTERQREYASAHGNGRRIYTPQMVVNGTANFVGSNRDEAKDAISNARDVKPIPMFLSGDSELTAKLPTLPKGSYSLQVFGYKRFHLEQIPSGENRGKDLRYTNSVTYIGDLEMWDGTSTEKTFSLPGLERREVDGLTMLVQSRRDSSVLGAGNVSTR